jgi:hypothetical protein
MVEAIGHIGELDRARCRQEAEHRFSPEHMAEQYERVYEQARDGLAAAAPSCRTSHVAI